MEFSNPQRYQKQGTAQVVVEQVENPVVQRAGRFTWPRGKLTLTITDNPSLRRDLLHFLDALKEAA